MMITKKMILNEKSGYDQPIRNIIRDIITIYKNNDDGEFYLPEETNDTYLEYYFPGLSVSVELILEVDESIEDYRLNAALWKDEDVISVIIVYNPKIKEQMTYDLIGSLNEVIGHELQHYKQRKNKSFDLYGSDEPNDPYEYYSQPHEIDAQIEGFKRMAKVTKRPFESLVRNWFRTQKDIHNIPENKIEDVISLILKNKN